ncbi:MAG: hypothetical protein ABIL75_04340 [candidate division WOR-3 bacterium]
MKGIDSATFEKIHEKIKEKVKESEGITITEIEKMKDNTKLAEPFFRIEIPPNSILISERDLFVDEEKVYLKNKQITFNVSGKAGKAKGMPANLNTLFEELEKESNQFKEKDPDLFNLLEKFGYKERRKEINKEIYYFMGDSRNLDDIAENILTLAKLKIGYGKMKLSGENFEIRTEESPEEIKEDKINKWLEKIKEYITPELILKENYEEAIKKSERVAFLPVRPDWNEPKKMWGYYNPLTGLFYPTDGLIVLLNAFKDLVKNRDKERKYFIILDEMNLARVEYYMSDLLSLMENMWKADSLKGETAQIHPYLDSCILSEPKGLKDEQSGAYICENSKSEKCKECPYYPLLHPDEVKEGWKAEFEVPEGNPIPPRIAYPENLAIIGTVNVDETTFSFAPKVLDRAFVVEFNEVYVDEYCKEYEIPDGTFRNFVKVLNEILKPATLHFGYRVINEMWKYLEENGEKENPSDSSLDFLLKSKVLPKIHGTEERVGKVLKKLMLYCEDPQKEAKDLNPDDLKDSEKWWEKYEEKKEQLKFKDSAAKIREMYARLKDTGYCSYF